MKRKLLKLEGKILKVVKSHSPFSLPFSEFSITEVWHLFSGDQFREAEFHLLRWQSMVWVGMTRKKWHIFIRKQQLRAQGVAGSTAGTPLRNMPRDVIPRYKLYFKWLQVRDNSCQEGYPPALYLFGRDVVIRSGLCCRCVLLCCLAPVHRLHGEGGQQTLLSWRLTELFFRFRLREARSVAFPFWHYFLNFQSKIFSSF